MTFIVCVLHIRLWWAPPYASGMLSVTVWCTLRDLPSLICVQVALKEHFCGSLQPAALMDLLQVSQR